MISSITCIAGAYAQNLNALKKPAAARNSFGAIQAQPQNQQQVDTISKIAYKTKETVAKRYGEGSPVTIKASLDQDTIVFSSTGTQVNQNQVDSIMQFYLRKTNIPFKKI